MKVGALARLAVYGAGLAFLFAVAYALGTVLQR